MVILTLQKNIKYYFKITKWKLMFLSMKLQLKQFVPKCIAMFSSVLYTSN